MGLEFNKCCFCIELRTGCLIIGYLNLIGNIALILFSILGLTALSVAATQTHKEEQQAAITVGIGIVGVLLFFMILFLAFTIVLLVGLHQYKRGHVKAYMIYALIFIVLYIIMFFAKFAGQITVGGVAYDLINILLSIYFLLVIRSYYLKMNDPANKPAVYNTA